MDNNWKLSDLHRKIEAARNDDMSAFSSPEEYAEYKQQSELLDPSNFMGMGSTRAVRELGPDLANKIQKYLDNAPSPLNKLDQFLELSGSNQNINKQILNSLKEKDLSAKELVLTPIFKRGTSSSLPPADRLVEKNLLTPTNAPQIQGRFTSDPDYNLMREYNTINDKYSNIKQFLKAGK